MKPERLNRGTMFFEGEWVDFVIDPVETTAVLNARERRHVELKAIEQAFLQAQLARIEPVLLVPTPTDRQSWPFELTPLDREILRLLKISAV